MKHKIFALFSVLLLMSTAHTITPLERMHAEEKHVFVTIGHRADLTRLQFAVDEKDPYVLLGLEQIAVFTNAQAIIEKTLKQKLDVFTTELRQGRRLFKLSKLDALRSDILFALMEQEGGQEVCNQLITLFDTLVDAQVDVTNELLGAVRRTILICDGERNQAVTFEEKRAPIVVSGGWLAPTIATAILQPPKIILVDGDLKASSIRTNCISPAVPRFPQAAPSGVQLQNVILPPQNNLGVNAAEVAKIHFVGEIPVGNLLAAGANQKGIKVLFNSIPEGGVYIKIGFNAKSGSQAAFYLADGYVRRNGVVNVYDVENIGPATITGTLVSNLPGSVSFRVSSNIALTNGTISYKVVGNNINCVVLNQA